MGEYKPISCQFYDYIEHYATLGVEVEILYYNENDKEEKTKARILTTQIKNGAEYIALSTFPSLIRLDKIIGINDKLINSFSC